MNAVCFQYTLQVNQNEIVLRQEVQLIRYAWEASKIKFKKRYNIFKKHVF